MKALVYTATRQIDIQDVPEPACAGGDVVIEVAAVGICGSELEAYLGKSRRRVPPLVMGHEFTGVVRSIGGDAGSVSPGARVAVQPLISCHACPECERGQTNVCRSRRLMSVELPGGYAEYAAVPASALFPLPQDVSMEVGTLAEPLANAVHIIERARYRVLEKLVVVGGGAIGCLVAMLARSIGIDNIAFIEPNTKKHAVLSSLGAELVLDPGEAGSLAEVLEWSGGGADVVVDASGAAEARKFAVGCAAPGAEVVLVGQGSASSDADHRDIIARELTIRGSYAYTNSDFRRALALLAAGKIDSNKIIRTIPLTDGPNAFTQLAAGETSDIKVVMLP